MALQQIVTEHLAKDGKAIEWIPTPLVVPDDEAKKEDNEKVWASISAVGPQKQGKSARLDEFLDDGDPHDFKVGDADLVRTTLGVLAKIQSTSRRILCDTEGLASMDKTLDLVKQLEAHGKTWKDCEAMVTKQDAILMLGTVLSSSIIFYVLRGLDLDDLIDFLQRLSSAAVLARRHLDANGDPGSKRLVILSVNRVAEKTTVEQIRNFVNRLADANHFRENIDFLFQIEIEIMPMSPVDRKEHHKHTMKQYIEPFHARARDLMFASPKHWDDFRMHVINVLKVQDNDPAFIQIVERNVLLCTEANKAMATRHVEAEYLLGLTKDNVQTMADHLSRKQKTHALYNRDAVGPAKAIQAGREHLETAANSYYVVRYAICEAPARCGHAGCKCTSGKNVAHDGPHPCRTVTSNCTRRQLHPVQHEHGQPVPDCGLCCLSDCNGSCGHNNRPCTLGRNHAGSTHQCGHGRQEPIRCVNPSCTNTQNTHCGDPVTHAICLHRNSVTTSVHAGWDLNTLTFGRIGGDNGHWVNWNCHATRLTTVTTSQTYCNGVTVPGSVNQRTVPTPNQYCGCGSWGHNRKEHQSRWENLSGDHTDVFSSRCPG